MQNLSIPNLPPRRPQPFSFPAYISLLLDGELTPEKVAVAEVNQRRRRPRGGRGGRRFLAGISQFRTQTVAARQRAIIPIVVRGVMCAILPDVDPFSIFGKAPAEKDFSLAL